MTALYRKWRPRTFDELKGQDAIVTTLKNQIMTNRVGHAYLFCGTRGTGKTSAAKILARAVNCEHPVNGSPCNECETCRSILTESSMNVVEIDAASNNGVDNIRDIKEQVMYPPTSGKYRVFIIDEVHMLSAGAFNALLKTLEEPPEYVVFILATTEVHKIPVTVLSRCQRYDFKRIPASVIADRLREMTGAEGILIEDKAIDFIARSSDGALRDALSLLDECRAFHPDGNISYDQVLEIAGAADMTAMSRLFYAVVSGNIAEALGEIDAAVCAGRELSQYTADFLWYMRNLLIIKSSDDPSGIIDASAENLEYMKICAAETTKEALMRYIRVFAELINQMRYSPQKRVLLELAVIKVMTPEMEQNLDSVLERVSRLEKRIDSGEIRVSAETVSKTEEAGQLPAGKLPEEEKTSRTVELPKAQYEQLMKMRADWNEIVDSLDGLSRPIMRGSEVEPCGEDMTVVFHDSGKFALKKSIDKALERTAELLKERYGCTFTLRTRLKEDDEKETIYVSREELGRLINMEIEQDG